MRRLLICPGAIGDCILRFPALEHLVVEFTEVWVPTSVVPLIRFADVVRPIASTGIDLVGVGDLAIDPTLESRLQQFDEIVSWYGTSRREFREALASIGVRCQFHAALPPPLDSPEHAIDFFARQVGAPDGLVPRIGIDSIESRNSIVIHPFSGSARKNWPLHLYRELAARLCAETGARIEWTAGPEEDLPEAIRFADLGQLARWIRGARLYIGNDSGITHLAAAVGTQTIALFGPSSPGNWAPRGNNVNVLHTNSLQSLIVEAVLSRARAMFH